MFGFFSVTRSLNLILEIIFVFNSEISVEIAIAIEILSL
jgi:hypothetical protein